MKGGESNLRLLPGVHAIDVGRRELRLDDQSLFLGDDVEQRLAGAHHLSDSEDLQVLHRAGNRRGDVDPPQDVLGDREPLMQIGKLLTRVDQGRCDLFLEFFLELLDLGTYTRRSLPALSQRR